MFNYLKDSRTVPFPPNNNKIYFVLNIKTAMSITGTWPSLPYEDWKEVLDTLHMKMQVVGKVKLAFNSFLNQWWQVAFYLNMRGFTTGLIPYKDGVFEIDFDFTDHKLYLRTINKQSKSIPLDETPVSEFYRSFMDLLNSEGIYVWINTMPCEFSDPVRFELDYGKKSYNKDFVYIWWTILLKIQKVFESFRSEFRGKSSPVHFFWGSFDLCGTRFSGNLCDYPVGSGTIMKFAENEENFTFGFWPGDKNYPRAAFYSYFFPSPSGIENALQDNKSFYNQQMREFILDYHEVAGSQNPEERIFEFLNVTYESGAKLAGWDVESLKCEIPANYKFQR